MDSRPEVRRQTTDVLIVCLTLLAPIMGGSTVLWAKGVLLLGAVLVLWLDPPRSLPPAWMLWTAGVLVLLPILAFVPVGWIGPASYRSALLEEVGLDLGGLLTVQPWMTLEAALMWYGGILWALALACRQWSLSRVTLLRSFVGGMAGLALAALTCHAVGRMPEVWNPSTHFGFFPNRNQTGNVLALAGVVSLALGGRALLLGRLSAWTWFGVFLLLGFAVVVNGSRAGVLIFLGGSFIWTVWTAASRRSARRLGWGIASVLGLVTLFMVFGGATLDRFIQPGEPPPSLAEDLSLRTDPGAYRLAREASWHGIGLGNFAAVFPQYEEDVSPVKTAIHPESDWVWLQIELGWMAPILVLGAALIWLIRHRPRVSEPDFLVRVALALAGFLFLLHGFADVSGHRPGSLWPALFLLALLREPLQTIPARRRAPVPRWFYGLASLPPALAAGLWLLPVPWQPIPTSARAAQLMHKIELSLTAQAYAPAKQTADQVVAWRPLDPEVHFYRALAGVYADAPIEEPILDFARVRRLNRRDPRFPQYEGSAWLSREPSLAFGAWQETLRRAGPDRASYYSEILAVGSTVPEARRELFSLAFGDTELLLVFLKQGPKEESQEEIDKWVMDDPDLERLSSGQRQEFLRIWAEHGDLERLARWLDTHPAHLREVWHARALVAAGTGDSRQACALAEQFCPLVMLPDVLDPRIENELRRRLTLVPDDFAALYALYRLQLVGADPTAALDTLRQGTRLGHCPPYFHYLEALAWTRMELWDEAWTSWKRYLSLVSWKEKIPSALTVEVRRLQPIIDVNPIPAT